MAKFPLRGGGLRYTVEGPVEYIVHCHGSECRRSYASLVGTGAIIDPELVSIDCGESQLTVFEKPPGVKRQFCRSCGCSLFYFHFAYPSMIFYYPATLDGGAHPGPAVDREHHIYVDSKAEWEAFNDGLPRDAEGWLSAEISPVDRFDWRAGIHGSWPAELEASR